VNGRLIVRPGFYFFFGRVNLTSVAFNDGALPDHAVQRGQPLLVDSKPGLRLQLHADPGEAACSRVQDLDHDRVPRHLFECAENNL
jgi:hypothetical protein